MPRMADVAKTCPFDPNVNTTMEAITIIKSERNDYKLLRIF